MPSSGLCSYTYYIAQCNPLTYPICHNSCTVMKEGQVISDSHYSTHSCSHWAHIHRYKAVQVQRASQSHTHTTQQLQWGWEGYSHTLHNGGGRDTVTHTHYTTIAMGVGGIQSHTHTTQQLQWGLEGYSHTLHNGVGRDTVTHTLHNNCNGGGRDTVTHYTMGVGGIRG